MIDEYNFGLITINGETYDHDVEVFWTEEVSDWWRKESHIIDVEDVVEAVELKPESIVIGTGASGMAKVTEEAKKFIEGRGIKLFIDPTEQAVKTFNVRKEESREEEGRMEKVIGLFHLTC